MSCVRMARPMSHTLNVNVTRELAPTEVPPLRSLCFLLFDSIACSRFRQRWFRCPVAPAAASTDDEVTGQQDGRRLASLRGYRGSSLAAEGFDCVEGLSRSSLSTRS